MSSEKGNSKRTRSQKFQNSHGFKNTLHDTSRRTKQINSTEVKDCCARCMEIIDWKIKYKKYKLLTAPKKCVRCGEKSVRQSYTVACNACADEFKICAKCNQEKDKVAASGLSPAEEASRAAQLDQELKALPERKRRTFLRLQAQGKVSTDALREAQMSDEEESDDGGS